MTSFLFCVFFLFLIMGVPIAISLGVASICTLLVGTHMPLLILPQKIYNGVNSFPYMAIPLFLLAGKKVREYGSNAVFPQYLDLFYYFFVKRIRRERDGARIP